ncbi:MAG: glycoside hydrolase family 99-like domain-containing protein [Treponema sp.]|nr:glycoside hydrolase family 99-like domain-containing protein [Treponema sp.]
MSKPRVIAFYLPQFHPIPENDEWWGKGFTEWTNVGKAKPLFPGHKQPKVPADLGYYDLRVPEVREQQAALAKEAGIEGFCYWHYWFDEDKQLLERPFNEVLASGKPDFPFCLAWANESWYAKLWDKDVKKDKLLIEQTYKGVEQYTKHFYDVLPAFKDSRYITVDDKPVFVIYKPLATEEIKVFIETWRKLAVENGLKGLYLIGHCFNDRARVDEYRKLDLDAINICSINDFSKKRTFINKTVTYLWRHTFKRPYIVSYKKVSKLFFNKNIDSAHDICPSIITGWDHTPRSGARGTIFKDETPKQFGEHVKTVIDNAKGEFVFIKSWNEWAEGNYLEPDLEWGHAYLDTLRNILSCWVGV